MNLDVSNTLTVEAVKLFETLAEEAYKDISALPEGSQPLWFRLNKRTI